MKYKPQRSEIKVREARPLVENTSKGVAIKCPFCVPAHVLLPGVQSPCGTTLKVTAVQPYYTSRATKSRGVACVKCGKIGGEMVKYRNGYVHMVECTPGVKLLTEIPPLSKVAKVIFKLPPKLRSIFEKRMGVAKKLEQIDTEGKPTGVILGYFFWKGK